ncbi:MAG: peptidylprolyl isomerase [Clostridia bacterium]|nr:peptidylprolyl isomerase [Clostridia bacterium]
MSKSNRIKMNRANAPVEEVVVKKSMNPVLKKVLIWALVVIILLVSAGILTISAINKNGTLLRTSDGVIIDGETFKASEVDYYYTLYEQSLYSTAYEYYTNYGIDVYGIDFSKSLFKQSYTQDSDKDGNPDYATWGDYVKEQAVTTLFNYVLMNNEAKANGFLDIPGMQEQIDRSVAQTVAETKAEAESQDISYLSYLRFYYGSTVTEEVYEKALRRETIANFYSTHVFNSIEVEDWEIAAEYGDNKNNYDTVDYLTFAVTVTLDEHLDENGEKVTNDETKEADDKKMTEASLALKEKLDAVTDKEGFVALAKEYNAKEGDAADKQYATLKEKVGFSALTDSEAAVLFADTASEGDTFINREDNVLNVFYFISRDDNHYNTREFRHVLLKSAEKDEAVLAEAEAILAEWKSGAATEETFGELASKYTEDTGSIVKGGFIDKVGVDTVIPEISAWLFDEARAEGDTEIIFSEDYGYHIVFYCGEGEMEYWEALCDDALRTKEYETETAEVIAKHSYKVLDGLGRIR